MYALIIFGVVTLLVALLLGKLWGMAWNKKWNFSGNRGLTIIVVSILCGLCLATVNGLYGGEFFKTETAKALAAIDGEMTAKEFSNDESTRAAVTVVKGMQKFAAEDEDEKVNAATNDTIVVKIDDTLVSTYFSTMTFLWSVFGVLVAGLVGGVAWAAYKDIKVVEKY